MSPTADYLSLVTSLPKTSPLTVLSLFFLSLMRLAPIVSIAPFLGAKLPGGVKIGLAIALAAIFLPHLITQNTQPLPFDGTFIAYSVKELLIGVILALLVSIPFHIAQSSGILVDFQRGSSALMATDPIIQTQVSPIGILYNYTLIVLFFQIDGPFTFFNAILQSYQIVPADHFLNPVFFNIHHPFWKLIVGLLTQFTAVSIQLAAPALVAILMGEMFLGIANRLAPQVQIAFLGMAIKSLLGIALLWASWFFILQQLAKQSTLWMETLQRILLTWQSS